LVWVLAGLLVGLIVGVEFAGWSGESACPKPFCADSAEIIPVTDRGYFQAVLPLIKEAQSTIHIASMELKYYESYPDSSVNEIVRELIRAHERGVEVKILLDEYSEKNNAFDVVKAAGVDVRWDDTETTTHSKLIIIDGKIVVVGSTNFSFYSLEKNREANVIIFDEDIAAYFEDYFTGLWR